MDAQIQQLQAQIQALQDQLAAGQPANPPQVPARAYKPIVPKTYSGGRTEKLEPWLFQVERYCEMAPVPIADRVKFAGGLLEGNPASWWLAVHGIIEHLPVGEQWESFKTQIKAHFQPINTQVDARTRLDQIHQRTSVLVYNTEFYEIMLQLPNMDEADRIHAYLKGLKPAVANQVAMQQPTELLTAQSLANTTDTIQFQHMPRRPTFSHRAVERPTHRAEYRGPAPMDLDAIGKLTNEERERLRKNGGCFRCRKTGHLA
jgi:Ty3 transposon capsid-like protein